jgi:hypothetical protein
MSAPDWVARAKVEPMALGRVGTATPIVSATAISSGGSAISC